MNCGFNTFHKRKTIADAPFGIGQFNSYQKPSHESPLGYPFPNGNPSSQPLGQLFMDNYQRSSLDLGSAYIQGGSTATWNIVGNALQMANVGTGGFDEYIRYQAYGTTALLFWKQEILFALQEPKSATTFGLAIGMESVQANATTSIQCFFNCSSGVNGGKITIYRSGVAQIVSTSALVWNAGDLILLTAERINFTIRLTAKNVTSGTSTITTSFTFTQAVTGNTLETASQFTIYSCGGTIDAYWWKVSSNTLKNIKGVFIGDSITTGYCATSPAKSYVGILSNYGNFKFSANAAPSCCTADMLAWSHQTVSMNPEYAFIMMGGNDIVFSIPASEYEENYIATCNIFRSHGIKIIHLLSTPRDPINVTPINTFLLTNRNFVNDTIIDTNTKLRASQTSTGINPAFCNDGTHPTDPGMAIIAQTIVTEAPQLFN